MVVGTANLCFDRVLEIEQTLLTVGADLINSLFRDQMLVRLGQCCPINAIVFEKFLAALADREAGTL